MRKFAQPVIIVSLAVSLVSIASAHTDQTAKAQSASVETNAALQAEANAARRKAKLEARLDEMKQKRCEVAAKVINQKTANRVRQAENHLRVFTSIAERIKAFASRREITIANLADLTADLDAKKAKVQADLDQLKTDAAEFECDGANPKATVEAFNADSKLIRADLKAFRQSVHNLKTAAQAALKAAGQDTE